MLDRVPAEPPSFVAGGVAICSGAPEQCARVFAGTAVAAATVKEGAPSATDNATAPPSSVVATARQSVFKLLIVVPMIQAKVAV